MPRAFSRLSLGTVICTWLLPMKVDGCGCDEDKPPQMDPEGFQRVGPSNREHAQRTFRLRSKSSWLSEMEPDNEELVGE